MISRFDHAIIGVRDLDAGIRRFEELGFTVIPGGTHTGQGTYNALIRFPDGYLELLAPIDPTSPSEVGHAILGGQEGLISYALQSDNLDAAVAGFRAAGLAAEPFGMERERSDGIVLAWRLLLPSGSLVRRPWPFLIEWSEESRQAMLREPVPDHPNGIDGVSGIVVAVQDLHQAMYVYGDVLGLELGSVRNIPDLQGSEISCNVGTLTIHLVVPMGPGPLQHKLEASGPGPYAILLHSSDMRRTERVLTDRGVRGQPLWSGLSGFSLPPEDTLSARLAILNG